MKKILVTDDDEAIRDLVSELLKQQGCSIETAFNGEMALEKLKTGTYDLLISDVIMPKVDGIELAMKVKGLYPDLPVLVLSAGRRSITADFNLNSAKMVGADRTLQKPFDQGEFLNVVNEMLAQT